MTMKTQQPKTMGCSKSSSKRQVYSSTIVPQETRNISNKQPNLTSKAIREKRTKKPQTVTRLIKQTHPTSTMISSAT